MKKQVLFWLTLAFLLFVPSSLAQENTLPASWRIAGGAWERQWWNNCGPATVTNALRFFGYNPANLDAAIANDQGYAEDFLKPDSRDKNVSPWQLVDFVNSLDSRATSVPVQAMLRLGGNLELAKTLIANNFPVIIEEGYDPPELGLGWMGHYLLLIGYDDSQSNFITHDSFGGADYPYSYEHIGEFWQHFNYNYIVVYDASREAELLELLGDNAERWNNTINAYNLAIAEASSDNNDAFAWYNIGTNSVYLAQMSREQGNESEALAYYGNAVSAYDQARTIGLPWRMLWYQFGLYEAYYEVAISNPAQASYFNEILSLVGTTIDSCVENDGLCHVEENYYWAGRAREALGETDRALTNYNTAIQINSNYQAAIDARDALLAGTGS
jgi:tetratricopeptide (TPR) repeat protein